jgi:3-deoxy-D-manno-octulosonate 8-phosphate phosphatase (KDO 8-P phosphatase)
MSYKEALQNITTFIFDVDGVLTDGSVILDSSEEMVRTMNTKDGFALQHAIKKGYNVCIITGGNSIMVKKRLQHLGIEDVFLAVHEKIGIFNSYLSKKNIATQQVLYMGDDLPDYPCIQAAGIGACPHDSAVEIREVSNYISHINGGKGCVRDVIEQTLRLHNKWFDKDSFKW